MFINKECKEIYLLYILITLINAFKIRILNLINYFESIKLIYIWKTYKYTKVNYIYKKWFSQLISKISSTFAVYTFFRREISYTSERKIYFFVFKHIFTWT